MQRADSRVYLAWALAHFLTAVLSIGLYALGGEDSDEKRWLGNAAIIEWSTQITSLFLLYWRIKYYGDMDTTHNARQHYKLVSVMHILSWCVVAYSTDDFVALIVQPVYWWTTSLFYFGGLGLFAFWASFHEQETNEKEDEKKKSQ
jgi:hypothetical protein